MEHAQDWEVNGRKETVKGAIRGSSEGFADIVFREFSHTTYLSIGAQNTVANQQVDCK